MKFNIWTVLAVSFASLFFSDLWNGRLTAGGDEASKRFSIRQTDSNGNTIYVIDCKTGKFIEIHTGPGGDYVAIRAKSDDSRPVIAITTDSVQLSSSDHKLRFITCPELQQLDRRNRGGWSAFKFE